MKKSVKTKKSVNNIRFEVYEHILDSAYVVVIGDHVDVTVSMIPLTPEERIVVNGIMNKAKCITQSKSARAFIELADRKR